MFFNIAIIKKAIVLYKVKIQMCSIELGQESAHLCWNLWLIYDCALQIGIHGTSQLSFHWQGHKLQFLLHYGNLI